MRDILRSMAPRNIETVQRGTWSSLSCSSIPVQPYRASSPKIAQKQHGPRTSYLASSNDGSISNGSGVLVSDGKPAILIRPSPTPCHTGKVCYENSSRNTTKCLVHVDVGMLMVPTNDAADTVVELIFSLCLDVKRVRFYQKL